MHKFQYKKNKNWTKNWGIFECEIKPDCSNCQVNTVTWTLKMNLFTVFPKLSKYSNQIFITFYNFYDIIALNKMWLLQSNERFYVTLSSYLKWFINKVDPNLNKHSKHFTNQIHCKF